MKKELPPSRTADQFVVRLPDGLRGRIAEAAKAAGRSMNSEIVARLQSTFAERNTEISVALDADTYAEIQRLAAASGRTLEQEMEDLSKPPYSVREVNAVVLLAAVRRLEKLIESMGQNGPKPQPGPPKLQEAK